ncbi:hypothetical protein [[Mycoplasma] collis]|uniref:hypothetical protein n=1 Tax=[Mycoplasma] collis TaxID=2127 RepID=UPI00051BFEDB|nr:hypothetical protein [[Mycoplasma] collis]
MNKNDFNIEDILLDNVEKKQSSFLKNKHSLKNENSFVVEIENNNVGQKKTFGFYLSIQIVEKLEKLAKEKNRNKSEILEIILDKFFKLNI